MDAGEVVADRFEIEGAAGTGAMGIVYRARDRATGATVALKIVRPETSERFRREARLLKALDHPGVVRYVAHGDSPEGPFLAMEWLEGEDLKSRLARGVLPVDEAVAMLRNAADALGAAHRHGVIHRDLKPANLWLEGGDPRRVKILDFGIARAELTTHTAPSADGSSPTHQTGAGLVLGTPAYMSPEQVRGSSAVDARADIYSLGCVLFRCLAGRTPFVGDDFVAVLAKTLVEAAPALVDLREDVPLALSDLVARMLDKDPAGRPPDAESLARELDTVLDPTAEQPRPSVRSGSVTAREQRVTSVILFRSTGPYEAVSRSVATFGARVEPMIGGTAVVLLEGDDTASDEVRRAASCALALRDGGLVEAIALATGRAERGVVPVGDVVDRAASLLAEGKRGIRVAEVTSALLGEEFDTTDGLLLGRRQGDRVRTLIGKPTPTVGREPELGQIEGIFSECVDERRARAVLVVGPAGVGKSRLRHELLRRLRAREERADVWIARGDPVGAGSSFGMVAQMVRRAAGVLEGEPIEEKRAKLAARVARHTKAEHAARVTCFLAEVIGAPLPDENNAMLRTARGDAMVMFDQIRMAWEDFVAGECDAHPLVIVLEDLHWGDLPTVTLLDGVLRLSADRPLMVLAFGRPNLTERFPELWKNHGVERIALRELSKRAAEKLARIALGPTAPDDVLGRIIERAAGNAFYLEELIRATAEGREDTPETALLMVQSRLEAMEPEARRVLRAASIFGRTFWVAGVAALVGTEGNAARWLRVLEERELVQPAPHGKLAGERELAFRHAIVQEAAHAMLTARDKVDGHHAAARWLERAGETDAASLAEHWERAGENARALAMWRRAAEQALEGNDFALCVANVERGVACGASGDVLGELRLLQTQAHNWRGELVEMAKAAEDAVALLPRGGVAWASAVDWAGVAYSRNGDGDGALRAGREITAVVVAGAAPALLAACGHVVSSLFFGGQREEARVLLDKLLAASHGVTEPMTRARIANALSSRAMFEGRTAEFIEHAIDATKWYAEAGNLRVAAATRSNIGWGLLELGVLRPAEEALGASKVEAERLGLRSIVAATQQNLGHCLFRQGRCEEALELQRRALDYFHATDDQGHECACHMYLVDVLAAMGDLEAAEVAARKSAELAAAAAPHSACVLAVASGLMLRAGRTDQALATAREAMARLEAHGVVEGEGRIRLALAEALEANGAHDEARRVIDQARARLLERAAGIRRPDWRECFLTSIWEHERTLDLARAWLGEP